MAEIKLGQLEQVDLRSIFPDEAHDFTPWLKQDENLALLGQTLNIDLELESTEKQVGQFRADILCKNAETDEWVLIENQIERTDHKHLGQLLTYAAGLDAVTIIWIADTFTDEHRAALDWLNEKTEENIRFFGLEFELWQIGNSNVAPKFNICSQPNNFTKSIHTAANQSLEDSKLKTMQLGFWNDFEDFLLKKKCNLTFKRAEPKNTFSKRIGIPGLKLTAALVSTSGSNPSLGQSLQFRIVCSNDDSYNQFKDVIDSLSNFDEGPLSWKTEEGMKRKTASTLLNINLDDKGSWERGFEWLQKRFESFTSELSKARQ